MNRLKRKIIVGITMGDPAGIGAEIIPKAINRLSGLAGLTIIGDKWVLDKVRSHKPGVTSYRLVDLANVVHKDFSFGRVRAEYGRASIEYLDKALELINNKEIDCLVTCPVSKKAISLAGFANFSGHTEYIAKRTGAKDFAMMLLNRELRFALVTRHIPLKHVPTGVDADKIYKLVILTHKALKELFLIKTPRIAVCGLNPHASDNGLLGREENEIINPALIRIRRRMGNVDGPLSADVAVLKATQRKYDCVIAMYHDQALIPLKMLGAYTGVNLTLGLPFIRTSPLHGTAFDIAGKSNLANPTSLIEAIKLAVICTLNQRRD